MVEISNDRLKAVENNIRDMINWVKVLQEDDKVSEEAANMMIDKLEDLARKTGELGAQ